MTVRLLEEHTGARASVIRKAIIHTPPAIVAVSLTALAVVSLLQGDSALPVGVIIFGLFAFSFSLQSIAAVRDLRATPITSHGEVRRAWTRARFLFIGRIHYFQIERRVFEVGAIAHGELRPGDTVDVVHWPHTNIIVTLHLHETERERDSKADRNLPWSSSQPPP
jgi:hypothetical protein